MSDVKTNRGESIDSRKRKQVRNVRNYIDKHRTEVQDIFRRARKALDHLGACRTIKSGEVYRSNGDYSVEQYRVWRTMRTSAWCGLAKVLTICNNLPPMSALSEKEKEDSEYVAIGWIDEVEGMMVQQYQWFPCKPWDDAR